MSRGTSGSAFSLIVSPAVVCCVKSRTMPSRTPDSCSFSLTRSVNSTSSSRWRDFTFRTYISVEPLCPLCLYALLSVQLGYHRGTKHTEIAQIDLFLAG